MAFEKILDLNADTTKKLDKAGETQTGYYLGFKTNQTAFGVSRLHIFNTAEGNVGIWGSKMLDDLLSQVKPGTMTQVQYLSTDVIKGGRKLKKYDVAQDKGNFIDVSTAVSATADESADEYADDDTVDASEEMIDEAPRSPLVKGKATSFGVQHAQQVNSLLNKK